VNHAKTDFYKGTVRITEYRGATNHPCQTMTANYGDPEHRRYIANWFHSAMLAGNTIKTEPVKAESEVQT